MERLGARLAPEVAALFPAGSEERARLSAFAARMVHTPPEWLAAAALTGWRVEPGEELLRQARAAPRVWAELAFEDLRTVLDLSDPAGALDPAEILRWGGRLPAMGPVDAHGNLGVLDSLERARRGLDGPRDRRGNRMHARNAGGGGFASFWLDLQPLWRPIEARGLSREDAERLFLRTLIKAWRQHADRVVAGPDGVPRLEVRVDGAWLPFAEAAEFDAARLAAAEAADPPGKPPGWTLTRDPDGSFRLDE
jgi:hypothetical protein